MSTINDVAKLAGVSAMTVSRVINNSGYISRETRSRVEAAIAELAYVPNAVGRQLRSKRTKMLALVLSDIMNPFFTTIARGVEDVARAQGFSVMFCNTDESEAEEAKYLLMLVQRQVDGVLLVPASTSGRSLRLLSSHHMPGRRPRPARPVPPHRQRPIGLRGRRVHADGAPHRAGSPPHRGPDRPPERLDLDRPRGRLLPGHARRRAGA
jgi:hypothetical protein